MFEQPPDLAPGRVLRLSQILQERTLWSEHLWRPGLQGRSLSDHEILEELVVELQKLTLLPATLLRNSLLSFRHLPLDYPLLSDICMRISGARRWMSETGMPVTSQPSPPGVLGEHTQVAIVDHYPDMRGLDDKPRVWLQFRILRGRTAGIAFRNSLPRKFLWVLSRELSWTRRRPWNGDPGEFCQMWCGGVLLPDKYDWARLDRIAVDGEMREHNDRLRRRRQRPCLRGYKWECSDCPIGYTDCPRGTHPRTWGVRTCKFYAGARRLGENRFHLGHFEPGSTGDVCFECRRVLGIRYEGDLVKPLEIT